MTMTSSPNNYLTECMEHGGEWYVVHSDQRTFSERVTRFYPTEEQAIVALDALAKEFYAEYPKYPADRLHVMRHKTLAEYRGHQRQIKETTCFNAEYYVIGDAENFNDHFKYLPKTHQLIINFPGRTVSCQCSAQPFCKLCVEQRPESTKCLTVPVIDKGADFSYDFSGIKNHIDAQQTYVLRLKDAKSTQHFVERKSFIFEGYWHSFRIALERNNADIKFSRYYNQFLNECLLPFQFCAHCLSKLSTPLRIRNNNRYTYRRNCPERLYPCRPLGTIFREILNKNNHQADTDESSYKRGICRTLSYFHNTTLNIFEDNATSKKLDEPLQLEEKQKLTLKTQYSHHCTEAEGCQTKYLEHGSRYQNFALTFPVWLEDGVSVGDSLRKIESKYRQAIQNQAQDKQSDGDPDSADRQNLGELIERRQHAGHRPAIEQSQVFDDLRRKRNGRFERFDAMTLQIPTFPIALFRWFRHILFGRLSHSLPLFWEES
ncbi:MAG: hypothetical protein WBD81_05495 [Collimonas pratensis]|uniref:hypothetical protein n=1 Tax=Collimonas pratensis TaxID=279113 RepID=UPI003C74900F